MTGRWRTRRTCGAKTRKGQPCVAKALPNGWCRHHGDYLHERRLFRRTALTTSRAWLFGAGARELEKAVNYEEMTGQEMPKFDSDFLQGVDWLDFDVMFEFR